MPRITRIDSHYNDTLGFLKLTCDDGSTGWGMYSPYEVPISITIAHDLLTRALFACDPDDIPGTLRHCERDHFLFKYKGGFFYRALCGLDTALYDRLGRLRQQPVYATLGGTARPIPLYASSLQRWTSIDDEIARFRHYRDTLGLRAFKFKIGIPAGEDTDSSPGKTEAFIRAMAAAFPPAEGYQLIADGNGGFSPARATQLSQLMADLGFSAFEEPTYCWDLAHAVELQKTTALPIMGMEQEYDLDRWAWLIDQRAINIVEPDVGYLGGITRTRAVLDLARQAGLPCSLHASNPSWLLNFSAHLMCAHTGPQPANLPLVEYGIENNPWLDGSFSPAPVIREGHLHLSDTPGWGTEPTAEWLAKAHHRTSTRP